MDALKSQPALPAPKRRWFQYSLRSLMLFVLCCSIACSWYATQVANQREAVRGILGIKGCTVAYDCDHSDQSPTLSPALLGLFFDDASLAARKETLAENLLGKDAVHWVVAAGVPLAQVTRAEPQLAKLPHLRNVYIVMDRGDDSTEVEARLQQDLPGVDVQAFPRCARCGVGTQENATEAVVSAAVSWLGLLIALSHI
jgi:hypothetical protein